MMSAPPFPKMYVVPAVERRARREGGETLGKPGRGQKLGTPQLHATRHPPPQLCSPGEQLAGGCPVRFAHAQTDVAASSRTQALITAE